MKLVEKFPNASYAEVTQYVNNEIAFLLKDGDKVVCPHKPVKCRDFLNDTLVWHKKQQKGTIYGYSYPGPIDEDKTRLMVTTPAYPSEHLRMENYEEFFHWLNGVEIELGVTPSVLTKLDTPKLSYMVEGDPVWQSSTVHLSFYTSLIRYLGTKLKTSPPKSLDQFILDAPKDSVNTRIAQYGVVRLGKAILSLKITEVSNSRTAPTSMHNINGFVSATTPALAASCVYGQELQTLLKL
jgi:hypothetical protein